MEHSDKNHPLGIDELVEQLAEYGIHAERKALYKDIAVLSEFGFPILQKRGVGGGYYTEGYPFDKEDIAYLRDAVMAAEFIPRRRSLELARKLDVFLSSDELDQRKDLVYMPLSRKIENHVSEKFTVIRSAVEQKRKIRFSYKEGEKETAYALTPYSVVRAAGDYWLVAGSGELENVLGFFCFDRMSSLYVSAEPYEDIRSLTGDVDFRVERYLDGAMETDMFGKEL